MADAPAAGGIDWSLRGLLMHVASEQAGALAAGAALAAGFGPVGAVASNAIVYFGPRIAGAWLDWLDRAAPAQAAAAIEALAEMPDDEARRIARAAVEKHAPPEASDADKSAVVEYLAAVPNAIRRSLPHDPATGRTTCDSGLVPKRVDDVLAMLPTSVPPFPVPSDLPGTPYRLIEVLGTGGFGCVYKAINPYEQYREPVAIKFCTDATLADSLRRERDLLDRLVHGGKAWSANIVRLFGHKLDATPPFLIYEYAGGGDLGNWLARRTGAPADANSVPTPPPKTGVVVPESAKANEAVATTEPAKPKRKGVPQGEALSIVRQIAGALAFAHDLGLVHRDLKPGNVLIDALDADGMTIRAVKLADFGISGVASEVTAETTRKGRSDWQGGGTTMRGGTLMAGSGTPLYMCEEQRRGEPADPRHDVYALGVLWYHLLAGNAARPMSFGWEQELRRRHGVSPQTIALIARCVGFFDDRPATGGALLKLLPNAPRGGGRLAMDPKRRARLLTIATGLAAFGLIAYRMMPEPEPVALAPVATPATQPDATASLAPAERVEALTRQADAVAAAGDHASAVRLYTQAIAAATEQGIASSATAAVAGRGTSRYRLAQVDGAVEDLDRAIAAGTRDPAVLTLRARVARDRKEYARAEELLSRAIALAPTAERLTDRAFARGATRPSDLTAVRQDCEAAYTLAPTAANAASVASVFEQQYGRSRDATFLRQALGWYETALSLDAGHLDAQNGKARAEATLASLAPPKPTESGEFEVPPAQRAASFYTRAEGRVAANDFASAVALYTDGLKLAPTAPAHAARGDALMRLDRNADAVADFDQALSLDPKNALAATGRARVAIEEKQYDRAVALLTTAIDVQPTAFRLGERGRAQFARGDLAAARADYLAAHRAEPRAEYATWAGLAFERDDVREAAKWYEAALKLDAGFRPARDGQSRVKEAIARLDAADRATRLAAESRQRAQQLAQQGKPREAIAQWDVAIRAEPGRAGDLYSRAEQYRASGDNARALADVDRALAIDANNAAYWTGRGVVLEGLSKLDDAEASYRRALTVTKEYAGATAGLERLKRARDAMSAAAEAAAQAKAAQAAAARVASADLVGLWNKGSSPEGKPSFLRFDADGQLYEFCATDPHDAANVHGHFAAKWTLAADGDRVAFEITQSADPMRYGAVGQRFDVPIRKAAAGLIDSTLKNGQSLRWTKVEAK